MRPLHAEMLSDCVLTGLKTRPPGWIVLSSETHYPISMMQYISTTTGPMTWERNWLCFANSLGEAQQITIFSDLNCSYEASWKFIYFREKFTITSKAHTIGYFKILLHVQQIAVGS